MKTNYARLIVLTFIVLFITPFLYAQTPPDETYTQNPFGGNLVLSSSYCQPYGSYYYEEDDYTEWYYEWEYYWRIEVPQNTPIKFEYTKNTNDYFEIYTNDQNVYRQFAYDNSTGSKSVTVISSDGYIYVKAWTCYYGEPPTGNIFTLNFNIDSSYSVSENSTVFQKDQYIGGKLGVGIQPIEKMEVQGSARINNRLSIGFPTVPTHINLSVSSSNNPDVTTSLYNNINKSTTSSVYGIQSYATNYSGNTYGIYSSVSGQTGKKWAGYFTGGDATVMNGNLGAGVESPLGILHVRGTGDNAWIYFGSNAGFTKPKPKIAYGLAFTWNLSGSEGESIISYSGGSRLDFNRWDGTNLATEMTLKTGSLGIGTNDPKAKLDVTGEIRSTLNNVSNIRMTGGSYSSMLRNDGISTYFLLTNNNDINGSWNSLRPFRIHNSTGDVAFADDRFQILHSTGTIIASGKIGIGLSDAATKLAASPADELLTVNGIIHAKEVKVDLTGSLADYVFSPDYSLMPLHKVEAFVKTNKHLPEIPSAAEVKEKGLSMGEMQNKLLQKIEELTLYVIEQQKQIEQLKKVIRK